MRMLWGVPSRTYSSLGTRISFAVTVVPGVRPVSRICPFRSVTYSPLLGPRGIPLESVTRKVTPSNGSFLAPSIYFWMVRFTPGTLYTVSVCVSAGFTVTTCRFVPGSMVNPGKVLVSSTTMVPTTGTWISPFRSVV